MTKKQSVFDQLYRQLIVSCQALPDEPLHSPFIMGKMACAAKEGGAKGIRANSVEDIREIKKQVNLPIIGIIKKVYGNCDVFITPTEVEVKALCEEGVEIIAMDATERIRPDGKTIVDVFPAYRQQYPDQLFMADCSTFAEACKAVEMGFDCVGTTLSGYTSYTRDTQLPNITLIEQLIEAGITVPVIAEGGIWTPEELKQVFELGIHTAVVGTAITRPQDITKRFIKAII